MIPDIIISSLSEQIKNEYQSAYLYLEIANYYETLGLDGFANWFKIQSKEEEDHAMLIYEYIHSNSGSVVFYPLQPMESNYSDLTQPLEDSLHHEEFITNCINRLVMLAEEENDIRTKDFLGWFVKEQQEEEENAHALLDKMRLFGGSASGLYMLNQEYSTRFYHQNYKLIKKD